METWIPEDIIIITIIISSSSGVGPSIFNEEINLKLKGARFANLVDPYTLP
jgi:hypothetical protein